MADIDVPGAADALFKSLKGLEKDIENQWPDLDFSSQFGHGGSSINPEDIGLNARYIARKYESYDWSGAKDLAATYFKDFVAKVEDARIRLVPQLSQAPSVYEAIITLLVSIDIQIGYFVDSSVIGKTMSLPIAVKRDVALIQRRLEKASSSIGGVEQKIAEIVKAHSVAVDLPATQEDLEQALADAQATRSALIKHETSAEAALLVIKEHQAALEARRDEAEAILQKINSAYAAATSEGLGKSFRAKAYSLNRSLYLWAGTLVVALGTAICIGSLRFPAIMGAVSSGVGQGGGWQSVIAQLALAGFSLGAPIWLAWVSTKQIGQRFRLSEDYAYKAALAGAYEGYRSEAARLDPILEAQLFSIALTRLDEIPLRLVENHVAGSPMHELVKTTEFGQALVTIPGLRDRLLEIFKRTRMKADLSKKMPASPDAATTE